MHMLKKAFVSQRHLQKGLWHAFLSQPGVQEWGRAMDGVVSVKAWVSMAHQPRACPAQGHFSTTDSCLTCPLSKHPPGRGGLPLWVGWVIWGTLEPWFER